MRLTMAQTESAMPGRKHTQPPRLKAAQAKKVRLRDAPYPGNFIRPSWGDEISNLCKEGGRGVRNRINASEPHILFKCESRNRR